MHSLLHKIESNMVHVQSNAHGLSGLYLATEAFSEDVERRLFKNRGLFGSEEDEADIAARKKRAGGAMGPQAPQTPGWGRDIWKLCRLIRDIFGADYVPGASDVVPDYCLPLSYPDGASFQRHYDSRYRWAEAIIGVNLGQESNIYFLRKDNQKVTVRLPRRSIYVMTGECRLAWKHGIQKQNVKKLDKPPTWNPHNLRRSLTLRATKAYSDAFLQHLLTTHTTNDASYRQRLEARIRQQNKFPPSLTGERMNAQELAAERERGKQTLQFVLNFPRLGASFDDANDGAADDHDDRYGSGGFFGTAAAAGFIAEMIQRQQMGGGGASRGTTTTTMGGGGTGYRLGDGSEQQQQNHHDNDDDDDDAQLLQAAIQASLQEQQQQHGGRHGGGRSSEQQQQQQQQQPQEQEQDDADLQAAIRLSLMQDQDAKQHKSKKSAAAAAAAARAPAESISLLSDDDDDDDDDDEDGDKKESRATIDDNKTDVGEDPSNKKMKSKSTVNDASKEKPTTAIVADVRAKRLLRFENNE